MKQAPIMEILNQLDEIIRNDHHEPPYILGGYIVGTTIVRDDIESIYEEYPSLEYIAELGADLETIEDTSIALPLLEEITARLAKFKTELNNPL